MARPRRFKFKITITGESDAFDPKDVDAHIRHNLLLTLALQERVDDIDIEVIEPFQGVRERFSKP